MSNESCWAYFAAYLEKQDMLSKLTEHEKLLHSYCGTPRSTPSRPSEIWNSQSQPPSRSGFTTTKGAEGGPQQKSSNGFFASKVIEAYQ